MMAPSEVVMAAPTAPEPDRGLLATSMARAARARLWPDYVWRPSRGGPEDDRTKQRVGSRGARRRTRGLSRAAALPARRRAHARARPDRGHLGACVLYPRRRVPARAPCRVRQPAAALDRRR